MGFFLTLFIYAALFVLAELIRPKPDLENEKPSDDVQAPTASENRPVPLYWGTVKIKGPNVIWYGDLRQIAIIDTIKTGLFSSESVVKGFTYEIGLQFAFGRGAVGVELLRVWIGEDVVFTGTVTHDTTFEIDCPELFGGDDLGNGGVTGIMRFFEGNQTQAVSTYLSNFQKSTTNSKTPAYRGTAYIAPDSNPIYVGNSLQIKPWAFEVRRLPNGLALTTGQAELNGGNDANPMNVIYEILTDTSWGLGIDLADIDTTNFKTAAATLATENNGFSYLHERVIEALDLIKLVEEQMDGVLFYNRRVGLWQVKLARLDYTPGTLPEIDEANTVDLKSFARSAWEETSNIVITQFKSRSDEYKETSAQAQDMANIEIRGLNATATKNYPGVKDPTLANTIAWRDLRTLSYPLAKTKVVVDRTFWDVNIGDVLEFSDADLGITRLPMRVTRADLNDLENNRVTLDLVQDVFAFVLPSGADPIDTSWTPPIDTLIAFPSDEQLAFEAPVAFISREPPVTEDVEQDRVWCTGRRQGSAVGYEIHQRHHPTVPSGSFLFSGQSFGFVLIGSLDANLASGSPYPLTSLDINTGPDGQTALESAFTDGQSPQDLGTDLVNLIYVTDGVSDGEFMLVSSAQNNASDVRLNNVYRGVLDSAQGNWSAGDKVYLIFNGGNLATSVFPPGNVVDIKLLPISISDKVAIGDATEIQISLDDRVRRPYPPSALRLGGTLWNSSISLENAGSDAEDFAVDSIIARRSFNTGRLARDEVAALDNDALNQFPEFTTEFGTDHEVDIYDTTGAPVLLFTDTFGGTTYNVLRIDVLHNNSGSLPTNLRLDIRARHTFQAIQYDSRQDLSFSFVVTSALTGQFEFGDLGFQIISATYTVDTAGIHNFTLSSAFSAGDVEVSINGGAFSQLIAAGMTTGATGSLAISDTIRIRHQSTDTTVTKHIDMTAPGAGTDAFGILFT